MHARHLGPGPEIIVCHRGASGQPIVTIHGRPLEDTGEDPLGVRVALVDDVLRYPDQQYVDCATDNAGKTCSGEVPTINPVAAAETSQIAVLQTGDSIGGEQ